MNPVRPFNCNHVDRPNGVMLVDKPSGITSHDVVLFLRRKFAIKKVGHAGTLDPMATGVLVMLLGTATKRSNDLITDDKEYEGTLRLGITTDTCDKEGRVVSTREVNEMPEDSIREAFLSFSGDIDQTPPIFSAIKHKGKKLYELARKGIEVQIKSRRVTIHEIEIKDINLPDITFRVRCSKGTYIRKLAHDLGEKLGCGAHLIALRRTRSGRFSIDDAVGLEDLKKFDGKALENRLIDIVK